MTHPKASMCRVCVHRDKNCSKLPFDKMPVIERYAGGIVVRCLEFKRNENTIPVLPMQAP